MMTMMMMMCDSRGIIVLRSGSMSNDRAVGRSNADAGRSGCARAEQCEYAVNPERVSRKPHISKIEK